MKEKIIRLLKSTDYGDHLLAINHLIKNRKLLVEILPVEKFINYSTPNSFLSVPDKKGIFHLKRKKFSILYGKSTIVRIPTKEIKHWIYTGYKILETYE